MYAKVEDVVKLKLSERCGKKTFIVSRLKILIPEFMSGIFFEATNSTKNLRILRKKNFKEDSIKKLPVLCPITMSKTFKVEFEYYILHEKE